MADEDDILVLPVSLNDSRAAAVARQAGIELMNAKMYKQALEQFEKMTKLERNNACNFEWCASAMIQLSQFGEAQGKIDKARKMAPYSPRAYVLECKLAMKRAGMDEIGPSADEKLLQELYVGYTDALRLDPQSTVLMERKVAIQKLLPADKRPQQSRCTANVDATRKQLMGYNKLIKKKYPAAFKYFKTCVELEPDNPAHLTWRSICLSQIKAKGNPYAVALRDAKRALRIQFGFARAWAALALAYYKLGDFDWAKEAFDECARHDARIPLHYEKEQAAIRKGVSKMKNAEPRPVPWQYSEGAAPAMAGSAEARQEVELEMDSMGAMTIRSQFKRVMMGNQKSQLDRSGKVIDLAPAPKSPRAAGQEPAAAPAPAPPPAAFTQINLKKVERVESDEEEESRSEEDVTPMSAFQKMAAASGGSSGGSRGWGSRAARAPSPAKSPRGGAKSPRKGSRKKRPKSPRKGGAKSPRGRSDPELDRFCSLIGGRVTRQQAAMLNPEKDIPEHLPLPDKLFMRSFVTELKSGSAVPIPAAAPPPPASALPPPVGGPSVEEIEAQNKKLEEEAARLEAEQAAIQAQMLKTEQEMQQLLTK